jgi:hypothetical protein
MLSKDRHPLKVRIALGDSAPCFLAPAKPSLLIGRLPQAALNDLIHENVIAQLRNLATHPSVALGLARSQLALHGWVYDIETGSIEALEVESNQFVSPAGYPNAWVRVPNHIGHLAPPRRVRTADTGRD